MVTTETLPLEASQIIHVVDPRLIAYMTTVIGDAQRLHAQGTFPSEQYYFHYPDLKLHKTYGSRESRAATIEMIAGPFLIIEHDVIKKYAEASQTIVDGFPAGYLIYYNRPGESQNQKPDSMYTTLRTWDLNVETMPNSADFKVTAKFSSCVGAYCNVPG
jgi:hypothetical protein